MKIVATKAMNDALHCANGADDQTRHIARGMVAALLTLVALMPMFAVANSEAETELLRAVGRDDCSAVERQLEAGASANMTFENYETGLPMPILLMATSLSACVADALVRHDADVNAVIPMPYNTPDRPLISPLAAAIFIGNIPVVEVLLNADAKTKLIDDQGHDLIPRYIDGLASRMARRGSPEKVDQVTELLEKYGGK